MTAMDERRVTWTPQLDPRFSDPEATPTGWSEVDRVLSDAELFWISTVRADGRPHVTPLVAVWHGDALHFCTGGDEQKAVNLATHPHVALTTGDARWEAGLDVVVEGEAERVTDRAVLGELAQRWRTRWDGRWRFEPVSEGFQHERGGGVALVFTVRPSKILAFAKGDRGGYTRFTPSRDEHAACAPDPAA